MPGAIGICGRQARIQHARRLEGHLAPIGEARHECEVAQAQVADGQSGDVWPQQAHAMALREYVMLISCYPGWNVHWEV